MKIHGNKSKKFTEEHRNKIRLANIGKKEGIILTKEHRERISKSLIGNKYALGCKHSDEIKNRLSRKMKGNKNAKGNRFFLTEEQKLKISLANKGKKRTEEMKKKMSIRQMGEKSFRWLGGISFEPYSIDWTDTLKKSIRERDHYTCQLCLKSGYPIHHIDYDKKNCDPMNLITLCESCHSKTNANRIHWKYYFMNLLKIKMNTLNLKKEKTKWAQLEI